jgi:hypothetical protein
MTVNEAIRALESIRDDMGGEALLRMADGMDVVRLRHTGPQVVYVTDIDVPADDGLRGIPPLCEPPPASAGGAAKREGQR